MKNLKTYESYKEPSKGDPLVGEYVICDIDDDYEYQDKIGRIVADVSSDMATFRTYEVSYEHTHDLVTVWDREILHHSFNKTGLEEIVAAKKFNI